MEKTFLKIPKPLYHLGFWAICGYLFTLPFNVPPLYIVLFFCGCVVGTYAIRYVLIPRFFNRQFLGFFLLSCLLLVGIFAWVSGRMIHSKNAIGAYGIFYFAFFAVLIFGISIRNSLRNTLKIKDLQKLQTETELNFLKAQVNPHFLFNTLNNLYATARIESPTTASGLLQLADLMRYMLTKANQKSVLLSEEIAYLDNYIDLEKRRLNEGANVSFLKKGDFLDKKIAPMLLLPFVENAFKHGAEKLLENVSIVINLSLQGNILYFQIENTKQFGDKHPLSIGSGLENAKKRFAIGYPKQHEIDIEETNEKFSVKLWINL